MNFSGISGTTLMGRILRQPLKLIPGHTSLPILQGRLKGKRWIAGSHTHGCWLGSYEIEKQQLFEATVKAGTTVFDIGANVGFYTLLASELVGASGRVYAFEPAPRNIVFLNKHLALNKVKNVELFEAAVSDKAGETYFDDTCGSAMGRIALTGNLRVKTVTLDQLVAQRKLPAPDCLKIDVEGAEAEVLNGAAHTLREFHPTIFLATHGPEVHQRCCKLLRSIGYRLEPIGGIGIDECDEILAVHSRSKNVPE